MTGLREQLGNAIAADKTVATGYKGWVRRHGDVVGLRKGQIERQCVQIESELSRLARAAQRRMCVGVFGASQAGKSYLISSLASKPGEKLLARAGERSLEFIGDINPRVGGKESTGVVTRFTNRLDVPDPAYPIELALLSELDIAKILANSYYADFQASARQSLTTDLIEAALAAAAIESDGKAHDRAFDLATYLQRQLDSEVYTVNFGPFEEYWGRISEIVERGTLPDRVKVYALLWGQDPYLTGAFEKMAEVLETLGHAEQCWARTDIFDDAANVIIVSTQNLIWNGSGVETVIRTADGTTASVDHATLSAMTAELKVVIENPPSEFYDTTDLLDFPGARTRNSADAVTAGNIGEALTRGKVAYLFDRYLDNRELTAMLLCIGDSVQEVGDLSRMVDRWIAVSHGDTAEARRDQDCALFVVLTKADKGFETGHKSAREMLENRILSSLERFEGSGDDHEGDSPREGSVSWKSEWVPGAPFRNAFWLRNTNLDTKGILSRGETNTVEFTETGYDDKYTEVFGALAEAVKASPKVRLHFAEPDTAWAEMLTLNDGGRSYLISNLRRVCHPEFKLRQLRREFLEFHNRLDALVREFFADGDAERVFKERSAAVMQALRDLRGCAHERKFGEFLLACYMSERSIKSILRQIEREVPEKGVAVIKPENDGWDDALFGEDAAEEVNGTGAVDVLEKHDQFARRVLDAWSEQLQENLENPRVSGYFHISQDNLQTIFREMREGAIRVELADRMAETARNASRFPRTAEKLIPHKARLAAQTLNAYVNRLGFDPGALRLRDKDQTPLFERPQLAEGAIPDLPRDPEPREVRAALHWAFAFKEMAETNARSDDGLKGVDLAANAELGRMIDQMSRDGE